MKMPWQVSATAFYHIFCRYYTLFAIFRLHELRHTFTTRLVEAGVNLKVIQDTLGHKDFSTTMDIYTDVTKELKQREFDNLQEKMNQKRYKEDKKTES